MKIHWRNNCVVRYVRNEGMVWRPRSGGCSVLVDAKPFLEEITDEWRDEQEIVVAVAQKFECRTDEIANDVRMVLDELIGQGFVECSGGDGKSMRGGANNAVSCADEREGGSIDDDSALGSIFLHNVSGITFRISSDVSLEVSGDYYLNRSDDFSTLFLVGASVSWKLSDRLSLFLTGSNLLNAEEYRRTSVSPLVESMEYVRLRPRTVLIGLDWRR